MKQYMGRPKGTKNMMRSPEEKEKIVKRYLNGETAIKLSKEINTAEGMIFEWTHKYEKFGITGLKSKTGKAKKPNNIFIGQISKKKKTREEELEFEIMKKDIEIARLKKGYVVKGDGLNKEYVTTFDVNTK